MRRNESSRTAVFALFLNRTIAGCHAPQGKPIVAAVAVDARSACGAQETMQCCVATVPVWYDDEIAALSLPEQLRRTRQMLWDEAKPENILASAQGLRRFNRMLEEQYPTLEEKKAFCIRRNEQAGSRYTYGISFVGELDFGKGVQEYVDSASAMEIEKAKDFFNQIIMHGDILAAMSAAMNPDPAGKNGTV